MVGRNTHREIEPPLPRMFQVATTAERSDALRRLAPKKGRKFAIAFVRQSQLGDDFEDGTLALAVLIEPANSPLVSVTGWLGHDPGPGRSKVGLLQTL
jgi:hypothetical protein